MQRRRRAIPANLQAAPQAAVEHQEMVGKQNSVVYASLSEQWLMPAYSSRAITRSYFNHVLRGTAYRRGRIEVEVYWANRPPVERQQHIHGSLLVNFRKFVLFLAELGQPALQMDFAHLPDAQWLLKQIRYLDTRNILDVFAAPSPIHGHHNYLDIPGSMIYAGKEAAKTILLGPNKPAFLAAHPFVADNLFEIWSLGQKATHHWLLINQQLNRPANAAEVLAGIQTQIENLITVTAISFFRIRNPQNQANNAALMAEQGAAIGNLSSW